MATTEKFQRCHAVTAKWEGGWSNHPSDPGGKTMYGITDAVYRQWRKMQGLAARPVRQITRIEAETIYFDNYWKPCGGPTLAAGVDLATYDASVNSGVSRGKKWLRASIGGSDVETVKKICARRLGFMQSLRIWRSFGRGWSRRVADIEAKGVAWALAARRWPVVNVRGGLEQEAVTANKQSQQKVVGATATASGSAGGAGVLNSNDVASLTAVPDWALWIAVAAVLALTAYLVFRAVHDRARAAAYEAEAKSL